ncbi:hypothetical protein Ccrd_000283 [Cynara cardunculus var. scolymus]|uniref:Uncharacterized protein n=1 Tax=Cynara cardunculus var. scolymus TaxID=59895 RepID=A0A124SDP7_CYNCS|nr:hypothetical protein Ccrd_000283 [Cynara cardunculus var. scolymus]
MRLLDNNMNTALENFSSFDVNLHGFIPVSADNFSDHHHPLAYMSLQDGTEAIPSFNFNGDPMNHFPTTTEVFGQLQRDGIATRVESFMNLNPPIFGPGFIEENKDYGVKKRKKNNEAGVEKAREVVHVRAKRGEATDSHSLAERFLSMKLSAASMFYDFNSSEMEDMETLKGTNGNEAQVMERMAREGYGGGDLPPFQSTWSP